MAFEFLLYNGNVIGFHWVFKLKCNPDGSVARYKA
jgi:hypothetical protein